MIGVGLAALAGWAVARAGLAPVGRLAAVAEDVTATGDPGRRVEVLIRLWLPGKAAWANPAPGAALAGSAP